MTMSRQPSVLHQASAKMAGSGHSVMSIRYWNDIVFLPAVQEVAGEVTKLDVRYLASEEHETGWTHRPRSVRYLASAVRWRA